MKRHHLFNAVMGVIVLITLTGCPPIQKVPEAGPSSELIGQVKAYLSADEAQANRMLPSLTKNSPEEVETALRRILTGPAEGNVPLGRMESRTVQVGTQAMSYGIYVPTSYRPDRSYPLIICLHGAGFDGDTYLDRWQPRLGEDYILACPTVEWGAWWTQQAEDLVQAVLSTVSRTYRVDLDRVFLTGMSNGGIGTFLIGLNHPDRFAALIPMAGVLPSALFPLLDNAQNIPFYLIHGAKDQVMPVRFSRDIKAYLEEVGYQVSYHEHDREHPIAGGHFFPQEELPELLGWLKTRSRKPVPSELTIVRDRDHPGRVYWAMIDQISPQAASFWASEHDPKESQLLKDGAYARLTVKVKENTFTVNTERVLRYSLLLHHDLADFSKPIQVLTNGRTSFKGYVKPDTGVLLREARRRPDPNQLVFSAVVIQVLP